MKIKRSRVFSFLAALTLVLVLTTALNCGCAIAAEAKAAPAAMDCHGEGEAAKASASNNVCCSGCEIAKQALTPAKTDLKSPDLLSTLPAFLPFSALSVLSNLEVFKSNLASRQNLPGAGSVSFHKQPLYLAVQVFLI